MVVDKKEADVGSLVEGDGQNLSVEPFRPLYIANTSLAELQLRICCESLHTQWEMMVEEGDRREDTDVRRSEDVESVLRGECVRGWDLREPCCTGLPIE